MSIQRSASTRQYIVVVRAICLGLLIIGVVSGIFVVVLGTQSHFSLQAMEETIRSWGVWGVVASIGLMVLHTFVPFPAEFLAIANGMVYGLIWGTIITWSGAMIGACLAFGLAKVLGRPFVERLLSSKDWRQIDQLVENRGTVVLLFSRFLPFIAFNLINCAAGVTGISWWTFGWTTGVGILPLTALMVATGVGIETMEWQTWVMLTAGVMFLCLVAWPTFRQLKKGGRASFPGWPLDGGGTSHNGRKAE